MKKASAVLIIIVFVVGLGIVNYPEVGVSLLENIIANKRSTTESETTGLKSGSNLQDSFNLLVVGADARYQEQNRTDTVMVVSFDLKTERIGVLSIPRDTRVRLPEDKGYHKINAAYAYGGIKLTKQVIEEEFQIPIDYHLQVGYQGFEELVNKLGGVEINVKNDLDYVDQAADLNIAIKAGQQNLTGEQALNYIRFRDEITGDIGRIERQQKFVKAALKQLLNLKTVLNLPGLIEQAMAAVKTNIELKEAVGLIRNFADINLNQVAMVVLPGEPDYIEGISYWLPNQKESETLINSLITTKKYFQYQAVKLSVLNGAGVPALAQQVSAVLSKQGYEIINVGNADHFDYQQNQVITSSQQAKEAAELADYLGGDLQVVDSQEQITVIIGRQNWG